MKPDYKARKRGEPTMPIKERLMQNVVKNPVSGCWEWQGCKRNGYGRMIVGSRTDGTRADNVADREAKGRNVIKVGEEQPQSKLTKKIVKDARWEHAYKGTSFQKLAGKYGVSKKTMQNAIKGVTWKCVSYFPEVPKEVE